MAKAKAKPEKTKWVDLRELSRDPLGVHLPDPAPDDYDLPDDDRKIGLLMRVADALERLAPKPDDPDDSEFDRNLCAKRRSYVAYLAARGIDGPAVVREIRASLPPHAVEAVSAASPEAHDLWALAPFLVYGSAFLSDADENYSRAGVPSVAVANQVLARYGLELE